ncbi:MAG: TolC family protein [Pirellulaceae bacterium]|nr:TolC family protein [Pirellulaceae bacterium]
MRIHQLRSMSVWMFTAWIVTTGCHPKKPFRFRDTWDSTPSYVKTVATEIEYPKVQSYLNANTTQIPEPLRLENPAELPNRELLLPEAINLALSNGDILRSLNASVVQINPLGVITKFNPALAEADPRIGVEAALSAFDARVAGRFFWQADNRPVNIDISDPIIGLFQVANFRGDLANFNYEITKFTATGARFAARHVVGYDYNNTPNRLYDGAFNGWFEAEWRQPLLRGAGVQYNRIAGPGSPNGVYNGVLIARINADITLADFEDGIINYVNEVESLYWELYFAYHNLEALVAGRNSALLTWQRVKELERVGARGGDAASEAQARSQYYGFDVQVREALTGPRGLYAIEQNLRYLLGLSATDGTLLKPVSQPMEGSVVYDWQTSLRDALTCRVEVRRQKWGIKRRELELLAARLNRRPTLDLVSQYRWRGFGDNLIDGYAAESSNSLYQDIFSGKYQEWFAGIEWGYPVGMRQAGAAVTHARLSLAREQAILEESELRISHDLSTASRSIARAYNLMEANFNRQQSDRDQVAALQARYEGGLDNINFLLQAQQQLVASQSAFFRSLVDYQLALRDFHREKGSLLLYNQVNLSEGPWASEAYEDAQQRGRFFAPRTRPNVTVPRPVSGGSFDPTSVGTGWSSEVTSNPETVVEASPG